MTALPAPTVRLYPRREVPLGGVRGSTVYRSLPQRDLPTVGAWCFLDQGVPGSPAGKVLPHPHIGLQTVTWLHAGAIRHRDTLGNDLEVRPAQLNLMTSGDGIVHSEFPVVAGMEFTGAQLWIALPDAARRGPAGFEHHRDLPVLTGPGVSATVLVGEFHGLRSPATVLSPIVGVDLSIAAGTSTVLRLRPDFEYAFYPLGGAAQVDGTSIAAGSIGYLGGGRQELSVSSTGGTQALLLGGEPFGEDLVMWWNFVARSHEEIVTARTDWESHSPRFGSIPSHGTDRIPAPPLPGLRLTPRRRRPVG